MAVRRMIQGSIVFIMVLSWTAAKQITEKTAKGKTSFVISTGQDVMSVNATDHALCEEELFCIEKAIIIPHVEDDDRKLASKITIMCDWGFSFPDGASMKDIDCERVVDEKGSVITQWQTLGGGCKPVLCPADNIENSLMIGNGTHGNALGDTQLVMCEDGYAFPDGKSFKQRSCVERVTYDGEVSFWRGEWEPRLQNCALQ